MKTSSMLVPVVLGILLQGPAVAQDRDELAFEEAAYKERGERDLEGALRIYERLASRAEVGKDIVVQSLLGMGRCYETLGRIDQARKSWTRIVEEHPDRTRAVAEARNGLRRIGEADAEEGEPKPDPAPGTGTGNWQSRLEGTTISLRFDKAPFSEVIRYLREEGEVPVRVDAEVLRAFEKEGKRITVAVEAIRLDKALRMVAAFSGLDFALGTDEIFVSWPGRVTAYRAGRAVEMSLSATVVADFHNAPLSHALSFFREMLGVNVVLDPALAGEADARPVRLQAEDVSLRGALERILGPHELAWASLHGAIYVGRGEDLARYKTLKWPSFRSVGSAEDREVVSTLETRKVSFDFENTLLETAANFWRASEGLNIVITPDAKQAAPGKKRTVSLAVNALPLGLALRLVLTPMGLTYRVEKGTLVIDARKAEETEPGGKRVEERTPSPAERRIRTILAEKKVRFDFHLARIQDVAAFVAASNDINVVVDPAVLRGFDEERRVANVQINGVTLEDALHVLLEALDLEYAVLHDALYIARPDALASYRSLSWPGTRSGTSRIAQALQQRRVSLDFEGAPLATVARFLSGASGIPVLIHPGVFETGEASERTVTLNVQAIPLASALRLILMPLGLRRREGCGAVLVEARNGEKPVPVFADALAARGEPGPAETDDPALEALLKALDGRTMSASFRGVGLREAIDFVRSNAGMNVVVDARVLSDPKVRKRTLDVEPKAGPVRDLLGAVAWAWDLQCAYLHGVAYVARPQDLERYREQAWFGDGLAGAGTDLDADAGERLAFLRETKVSADFVGAPLDRVVNCFDAVAGGSLSKALVAKGGVDPKKVRVTLKADGITLEHALRLALTPANLTYRIGEGGAVIVSKRGSEGR